MKTSSRLLVVVTAATGTLFSGAALAEVSANVGFASEYYYRGVLQKETSANAGIDYENSGFYIGAWTADVGDGLEIDGYLGYGIETESGFSASAGVTGYYYTGEFDDTYEEVNLNLGYKMVSVEYSVGTWDGFGFDEDYDFVALTLEHNGFYGTFASFGKDFTGDYVEVGYATEVGGFDVGIAAIFSDEDLSDQLDSNGMPDDSEALVFTISKTFSIN